MIAQFLSRNSRNGWTLIYFSAKIMGSKNACALEYAYILGRNIKCSVIIIINKHRTIWESLWSLSVTDA